MGLVGPCTRAALRLKTTGDPQLEATHRRGCVVPSEAPERPRRALRVSRRALVPQGKPSEPSGERPSPRVRCRVMAVSNQLDGPSATLASTSAVGGAVATMCCGCTW